MKTSVLSALIGAGCLLLANAEPAGAQLARTWVSGLGDDANDCSRATPCRSFSGAHGKTTAGGQISCVDPINNTTTTAISKSITIDCGGFPAAVPGITVNGADIIVIIRNLTIAGASTGLVGINFVNGTDLYVHNVVIKDFNSGAAQGIRFAPTAGALSRLFVSDSLITNNGLGANGGGIVVEPTGSVSARVVLDRVRVEGNTTGILSLGGGSAPIIVQIRDSVAAGNSSHGMSAVSTTGALSALVIDRTSATLNLGDGIRAQGTGALVHVGTSTVIGNVGGLIAVSGGSILSYQDNKASGNGADGGPTGVLTMK